MFVDFIVYCDGLVSVKKRVYLEIVNNTQLLQKERGTLNKKKR